MKVQSKLIILAVLIALVLALVPAVMAQDTTTATATSSAVNVRSGPGTEYTVRGVLFPDDVVTVTGRNDFAAGRFCRGINAVDLDMWLRIEFNGIEAWVTRCAMTIDGAVDSLPVVSPSNPILVSELQPLPGLPLTPGDDIEPAPDSAYVIGFTSARVNIRTAPNLGADVVIVASALEDFYIVGRTADSNWVQVSFGGETGWMVRYLVFLPRDWETIVPVK